MVELYYDKTSSQEIEQDFKAINLVPYLSLELFDSNVNFNFGLGTGYILNKYTTTDDSKTQKKLDIFAKFGLSYEYKKRISLELGFNPSVTDVVNNYLSRSKGYLGVKIPINNYIKKKK